MSSSIIAYKNAIVSVSDKRSIDTLVLFLLEQDFTIYSTGGTYEI